MHYQELIIFQPKTEWDNNSIENKMVVMDYCYDFETCVGSYLYSPLMEGVYLGADCLFDHLVNTECILGAKEINSHG